MKAGTQRHHPKRARRKTLPPKGEEGRKATTNQTEQRNKPNTTYMSQGKSDTTRKEVTQGNGDNRTTSKKERECSTGRHEATTPWNKMEERPHQEQKRLLRFFSQTCACWEDHSEPARITPQQRTLPRVKTVLRFLLVLRVGCSRSHARTFFTSTTRGLCHVEVRFTWIPVPVLYPPSKDHAIRDR